MFTSFDDRTVFVYVLTITLNEYIVNTFFEKSFFSNKTINIFTLRVKLTVNLKLITFSFKDFIFKAYYNLTYPKTIVNHF